MTFSLFSWVESGDGNSAWLYINSDPVEESYHQTHSESGMMVSTGGRQVTREVSEGDTIEIRAENKLGNSYRNIFYCAEYLPKM